VLKNKLKKAKMSFANVVIAIFFYTVPAIIIFWKLYQKAGHKGWAAVIPVYSSVVMAKIARKQILLGWIVGLAS
jgi:hypothetical protein